MYIELDDREIKLLKQYAKVYEGERDIDWTADPIVLVQNKVKRDVSGEHNFDLIEYEVYVDDRCICEDWLFSDLEEVIENIREYFIQGGDSGLDEEEFDEVTEDMRYHLEGFYSSDIWEYEGKHINITVKKRFFEYYYKTVAYFFTRAEAKKYVKYQAHNLHEPRVFASYAGYANNGDFPIFQKLLLRLGKQVLEE